MRRIKQEGSSIFLEGQEICRKYIETGQITFGTSELHPGVTGDIDPGHPNGQEVFFVAKGKVLMRNTNSGECFELNCGDAILVLENEPHELTNIGTENALVTWSLFEWKE